MIHENAKLLLLAPSTGFGGGIERVASAIERSWPGDTSRIDLYRSGWHVQARGNLGAKAAFSMSALAIARRSPVSAVVCMHLNLVPIAVTAAAAARAPAFVVAHGHEAWSPMRRWRRTLLRNRCRALAVSSFTADYLAQRAELDRAQVRVVYNPVGEAFAEEARAFHTASTASRSAFRLLTVSRITQRNRYKGHFAIADALPAVIERNPRTEWVVVGAGDNLPNLQRRCAQLGIERSVVFLGEVDDGALMDAYRAADVFVMPSIADPDASPPIGEGFGLVYAEAACFGVPSIASSAGGGSLEFVRHAETGLTVAPNDQRQLVDGILGLLGSEERRLELGTAARSLVLRRHLPEHYGLAFRAAIEL